MQRRSFGRGKVNGLTRSEHEVFMSYKKLGYNVLRGGYPDFLCHHPDGRHAFVEVKSGYDVLSERQSLMHDTLRRLGLRVFVEYVDVTEKYYYRNASGEMVEWQKDVIEW
jgi:hypothetical protein